MKLTEHFSEEEFRCHCCGKVRMDMVFLLALEQARRRAGVPFEVNSGFRCSAGNILAGGAKKSAHLRGKAADIAARTSFRRHKILQAAYQVGFQRVGVGSNFVHLDMDESLPTPRCWVYPGGK